MKKLFLYLTTLILAIPLDMAGEITGVAVSDGDNKVIFTFDEKPEVTFSESELILTTADRVVSFPVTNSVSFEFIDTADVDDNLLSELGFSFNSNEISLSGLTAGETVCIFSYDGKTIHTSQADSNGDWTISSDNLPRKALIIKTSKNAFKIIIR